MVAALVQQTGAASGTATLSTAATAHNCLIACLQGYGASTISGVTSAASVDHWASLVAVSGAGQVAAVWIDPDCAGGNTTVNFTAAGASQLNIQAYEFSGLGNAPAMDVTPSTHLVSTTPNAGTYTSNATAAADATDVWVGMYAGNDASSFSASGAVSPWNSQSATSQVISHLYTSLVSGYQIPGTSGTVTYSGSSSTSGAVYAVIALAIKPGSTSMPAGTAGSFLSFFA